MMVTTLKELLAEAGLASERVILMRHAPKKADQPAFRRDLIDLACKDRKLFEFYQSFHTSTTAKKIGSKGYLVSALPGAGKVAILYAVYRIKGSFRTLTASELRAEPLMQRLLDRGLKQPDKPNYTIIRFERTPLLNEFAGCVSFDWPWAALSWCMEATEAALNTSVSIEPTPRFRMTDA